MQKMLQQAQKTVEQQVRAIIERLPQRDLIPVARREYWISAILRAYPREAIWHAERLGGFGGSQIGALVMNANGKRATFSSARKIVRQSLMFELPDEPNEHMQRGKDTEGWNKAWFHQKFRCRTDAKAFEILSKGRGSRPWMRYSPDDTLVFDQGQFKGELALIDYKSPSEVSDEANDEGISFDYLCQLTQGAIIGSENGLKFSRYFLSQLDWKGWNLVVHHAPVDAALMKEVERAGDHFWNEFVMKGEVPPYVARLAVDEEVQLSLMDQAEKIAEKVALFKELERRADEEKEELKKVMDQHRLWGATAKYPSVSIQCDRTMDFESAAKRLGDEMAQGCLKPKYDIERLVRLAKELGANPEQLKKCAKEFVPDTDLYVKALQAAGEDPDEFIAAKYTYRLTPAVKQAAVQRVDAILAPPDFSGEGNDDSSREAPGQDAQRMVSG